MNRVIISIVTITLIVGCAAGLKSTGEGETGILYGDGHVYSLTAPNGWIIDNQSGVQQGLHAVFYPKGSSWESGTTTIYTRVTNKDEVIQDAESHVAFTLQQFHENNSPGSKADFLQDLPTRDGNIAKLYFYRGDQWGNNEVVAYIEEEKIIPIVVLTTKSQDDLEFALQPFFDIVSSYFFYGENLEETEFSYMKSEAPEEPSSEESILFHVGDDSNAVRTDADVIEAIGIVAQKMFTYHEAQRVIEIPDKETSSIIVIRVNPAGEIYSITPSYESTCEKHYEAKIIESLESCTFNRVPEDSEDSVFRMIMTFK